jgi:hypothetical protein
MRERSFGRVLSFFVYRIKTGLFNEKNSKNSKKTLDKAYLGVYNITGS